MSDTNERSVASAGSHGVAAAWAAFADDTGDTGVTSLNRASVEEVANRMGWSVVPLYSHLTLTDEERQVIFRAMYRAVGADSAILCSLLERTK
jgi:hypothetical protein